MASTSNNLVEAAPASNLACHHPLPAYRTATKAVLLGSEKIPSPNTLSLPCGSCDGCTAAQAKGWALRNQLEYYQHERTAFVTLTYDEPFLPINPVAPLGTLSRYDLQLYLKRVRKALGTARPLRFFGSGEYGEQNARPHYHLLLYGADIRDTDLLHDKWGKGWTRTDHVTPARIAYCAGYTAKKYGDRAKAAVTQIDYRTGEFHEWTPPFLQMSRRPGIGAQARQWVNSWRLFAINNGTKMPVPRYLHQAWLDQASPTDLEVLQQEKLSYAARRATSPMQLQAAEKIAHSRKAIQADRRKL